MAERALLAEMHVLLQFGDGGRAGGLSNFLQLGEGAEEAVAAVDADVGHYSRSSRTTIVAGATPAANDSISAPDLSAMITAPAEA